MKWTIALLVSVWLAFIFGPKFSRADMIAPGPYPPDNAMEKREQMKKEKAMPVYPVAAAVVVLTSGGSLAALYFIRKRNGN